MKKLVAGTALALCLMLPSQSKAEIINLTVNPTSATGHFSNEAVGLISDQITFQLIGGPLFVTFASATNDYAQSTDFITNFTGQLFEVVGGIGPIGGADLAVNPLVTAVPCQQNPTGCQILAGTALLDPGFYYLQIGGTGGTTAGYGGNLTTFAVPGPAAGAGIPGILAACAGFWAWRRRRQAAA